MSRRDLLITEMGLGPVWKLRGPVEEGAGEAVPEAVAESMPAAPFGPRTRLAPAAAAVSALTPADADEREQHILRMDWTELKLAVSGCQACALAKGRRNTVFGVGDEQAEWMLVGEAPGSEEDARGEAFVGQAGMLLDSMLAALDMTRDKNVYIANVLKCRPPGNRNPEPGEVAKCSPHLVRQVALVQPKLILALGRFAVQSLLNTDASIASLRGKVHHYQGVPVVVSYHPAYLLRNLADKAKAWEDLCFARQTLAAVVGTKAQ
jgi:DNA polymerase